MFSSFSYPDSVSIFLHTCVRTFNSMWNVMLEFPMIFLEVTGAFLVYVPIAFCEWGLCFPCLLGSSFDRYVSSVQELPLLSVQQPKKLVTWVEGRWLIFHFCLVLQDTNFISLAAPHHHPVQQFSACIWDLFGGWPSLSQGSHTKYPAQQIMNYNSWQ